MFSVVSDPNELTRMQKKAEAVDLRSRGWAYGEIATQIQVSVSAVAGYIAEAIDLARSNMVLTAQQMIELEDMELRRLRKVLEPDITARDQGAIALALKLSESRRKLHGLDNPEKHEHTVVFREFIGFDPMAAIRGELSHTVSDTPLVPETIEGEIVDVTS